MKNRLILKASAGTGKTYRLSLEYVASLCYGNDFKDILVMTFTKKATAEIKDRILKFLKIWKQKLLKILCSFSLLLILFLFFIVLVKIIIFYLLNITKLS